MQYNEILEEASKRKAEHQSRADLAQRIAEALKLKEFNTINKRMATYLEGALPGVRVIVGKEYTFNDRASVRAWFKDDYNTNIKIYTPVNQADILDQLEKMAAPYPEYDKTIAFVSDQKNLDKLNKLAKEMADLVNQSGSYTQKDLLAGVFSPLGIYLK